MLDIAKTIMKKSNQSQKLFIGLTLSMVVILFFGHNPISGYSTSYYVDKPLQACSTSDKQEYRDFLTTFYASKIGNDQREIAEMLGGVSKQIDRRVENCHLLGAGMHTDLDHIFNGDERPLHFSAWSSDRPLILWLGNVVNFIYSLLAVLVIGGIFIFFVFSKTSETE